MKRNFLCCKRWLSLLLVLSLLLGCVPFAAFAEEAAPETLATEPPVTEAAEVVETMEPTEETMEPTEETAEPTEETAEPTEETAEPTEETAESTEETEAAAALLSLEAPASLDDIAWENLTYRDIFIAGNLSYLDGFNGRTFYPFTQSAGTNTVTGEACYTGPYALAAFGSPSQQIKSRQKLAVGDYFVATKVYCTRYAAGELGICLYDTTVGVTQVTENFVTAAGLLSAETSGYIYIGSIHSADLDGYVDDPVVVPLTLFETVPTEEQLTVLYENYVALEKAIPREEVPFTDEEMLAAFVKYLQGKAESLGMESSSFVDPMGLENQSTANDLLKLMVYADSTYDLDYIWNAAEHTVTVRGDNARDQKVTSTVMKPELTDYCTVLGGKTGTLSDYDARNLAVILEIPGSNDRLAVVALYAEGQDGSDASRFDAVRQIADIAIANYENGTQDFSQDVCCKSAAACLIPANRTDISNLQILYRKDADTRRVLASITKVLTSVCALEVLGDWATEIEYKDFDTDIGSFYSGDFLPGDVVELRDTLYAMLLPSSNVTARAVARTAGGTILERDIPIPEAPEIPDAPEEPEDTLSGKTISILGDSISTFAGVSLCSSPFYDGSNRDVQSVYDTWWGKLIEDHGMSLCVNYSQGGVAMQNPVIYKERVLNLHTDNASPDVIFLFLGHNDKLEQVKPFEDIRWSTLIQENADGTYTYAEPDSFTEAYVVAVHKMLKQYPAAEVVLLQCLTTGTSEKYNQINPIIQAIGDQFGLTVVDFYGNGLSRENKTYFPSDVHPSKAGMEKMADILGQVLENMHLHSFQQTVTAPTCTEGGYTTYTCACGDSYQDDFLEPVWHENREGRCAMCGCQVLRIFREDLIQYQGGVNAETGRLNTSFINNWYADILIPGGARQVYVQTFKTGGSWGSAFFKNTTFLSGFCDPNVGGQWTVEAIPEGATLLRYSYLYDSIAQENQTPVFQYIEFAGTELEAWEPNRFLARPATGCHSFTVEVNIAPAQGDPEGYAPGTDYGYIQLPTNYSAYGEPTRLIIVCHGAGAGLDTYQSSDWKTTNYSFWTDLGYAVMDMYASPTELTGDGSCLHYGNPVVLDCYKEGYDYVMEHFNLKQDGIYVIGASMGGLSSFQIVQSGLFPVLAQVAYCPVIDLFKQAYCNPWTTASYQRSRIAEYFGFTGAEPAFTNSKFPSEAEIEYYRQNFEKTLALSPILARVVKGDAANIIDVIPQSPTAYDMTEEMIYSYLTAEHPCPLLIFHNTDDSTVAYRYSQYFVDMVNRSGQEAMLYPFTSGGHNAWANGESFQLQGINGQITVKESQYEAYLFFDELEQHWDHTPWTDPAVEATCTQTGLTEGVHCAACGEILEAQAVTPALGHSWADSSAVVKECLRCGYGEGGYRIEVTAGEVWIDGEKQWIYQNSSGTYILLERTDAEIMTVYSYNDLTETQYPTGMQVWRLSFENGAYTAAYVPEFEDLLQYAGSSIRVTGIKGIRMITGIDKGLRASLMEGSLGYTLVEYGTVVAWSSASDSVPVLGQGSAMHNYAYKKDVADPIFADTGDTIQYTNVLVGFTDDQLAEDLILRPYIILEDSNGEQLTVYGGCVQRSIGYIAKQNQDTFPENSKADAYIEDIISKVYG